MTLEQLRARLAEINAKCSAIVDDADQNNKGLMTEEQQTEFDSLTSEHKQVLAAIERKMKLEDMSAQSNEGSGRQSTPNQTSVEFIRDRSAAHDESGGFEDIAEFASAVRVACQRGGIVDERLRALSDGQVVSAPTNFHQETGSSDGYMVPPAMRNQIWELVFNDEDLLNMVDSEPTSSNSVELLADETTPWGSTGIQANWAAEGTQFTPSRLETEGRQTKLHKLYAYVLATEELLEDGPRLNNRLTRGAARAIRWKASNAIAYGSGSGQPLGYFNSPALVSVAKEGSQAADTIVTLNIAKMFSRMFGESIRRAVWLTNSDALPQLMTLTIANQPVWTPPGNGMQQAPGGFLMGRPVLFTEHAKTLGDKGDIQLVDPKGYYAAVKRGGMKFAQSIHLYFDYDIQAFRWTFRFGGQPYLSAPVSPANGTNTKSHFVTLDERA